MALAQPYYKEKGTLLVLGIAADHDDAVRLSARIDNQVYQKTGGFDVAGFTPGKSERVGESGMLHVLLFVLKILGIILLAVLGVILAGVLLALFVPVRYRAEVKLL